MCEGQSIFEGWTTEMTVWNGSASTTVERQCPVRTRHRRLGLTQSMPEYSCTQRFEMKPWSSCVSAKFSSGVRFPSSRCGPPAPKGWQSAAPKAVAGQKGGERGSGRRCEEAVAGQRKAVAVAGQ